MPDQAPTNRAVASLQSREEVFVARGPCKKGTCLCCSGLESRGKNLETLGLGQVPCFHVVLSSLVRRNLEVCQTGSPMC